MPETEFKTLRDRSYVGLRARVREDERIFAIRRDRAGMYVGTVTQRNNTTDNGSTMTGEKLDNGKPMLDLIPPLMELEVGTVLTFGAEKYSIENWRQVPDLRRRYIAAAMRHINALRRGEIVDPESGLHHAAHAVTCLMFLGEVELEQKEASRA